MIVNLDQAYQVWMDALRTLNDMPYNLRIKEVSGRKYLYEITDRRGGQGANSSAEETECNLRPLELLFGDFRLSEIRNSFVNGFICSEKD